VKEFIISNYKQTWANISKLADAPEGVKQLSFKSLDYYGPLSPEERRKSRHLNIDTMGQRQNGMPMANLCSKGAPGPRESEESLPKFSSLIPERRQRSSYQARGLR